MARIPWYINSRPYSYEGGGDIFVGTQSEADKYAQSVGQHRGNQVSGVQNGLVRRAVDDKGNPVTMDGEQVYENPYMLDDVVVKAPNLQVAKAARERPNYRGLNGFANAAVGGLVGLAGYYGGQLWDSAWKAGTGNDWGASVLNGVNRIGDETGLYHVDPNNRYAQFVAGLTNPGMWVGGAAAGRALGRPSIMGAPAEPLVSTKGLSFRDAMERAGAEGRTLMRDLGEYSPAIVETKASRVGIDSRRQPANRYKVGDLEINDPNASYRQGRGIVEDFAKSGTVRTNYDNVPQVKKGLYLYNKEFADPMFNKGSLFYGNNTKAYPEVLMTYENMLPYRHKGHPNIRIQQTEGQLNSINTNPYIYEPGYGYRLIKPNESVKVELSAPQTNSTGKTQTNSSSKAEPAKERTMDDLIEFRRWRSGLNFEKGTKRPSDAFIFRKDDRHAGRKFNFRKDYTGRPIKFDFKKEPDTMRSKAESWLINHGLGWLVKDENGNFGF